MSDMEFQCRPGVDVQTFAREAVALRANVNQDFYAVHNDRRVLVTFTTDAASFVKRWDALGGTPKVDRDADAAIALVRQRVADDFENAKPSYTAEEVGGGWDLFTREHAMRIARWGKA